jgi:hypothetical protein
LKGAKKVADKTEAAEAKKNCGECKKPVKKAKKYYRDGVYYCNKNCYKKKISKAAKPEEGA